MDRPGDFAALDDSVKYHGRIYVYGHGLVLPDDEVRFHLFTGSKSVYSCESALYSFILENLPEGCRLYACSHYRRYRSVWEDLVNEEVNRRIMGGLPKLVRNRFLEAHNLAKQKVTEGLKSIIDDQGAG